MSRYAYSRLSAQDNDFLRWESRRLPMHGVAVQIFACGPLARGGGVNFEAIREAVAAALPRMPRYRQRVVRIPGSTRAVWVDDEHFDLRPGAIIRDLDLLRPIYAKTAAYGHFGRDDRDFTWERTDKADALRAAAGVLSEAPA
jgi:hypothetical protein